MELMIITARRIWLQRNTLVFEGVFCHPSEILEGAVVSLGEFQRCNNPDLSPGDRYEGVLPASRQLRWRPPPNGFIKINWDNAINEKEGCTGLGI